MSYRGAQISRWKAEFLKNAAAAFGGSTERTEKDIQAGRDRHLRKIGELEMKPYLLRHLDINHPNHVWSIDITYIPMRKGFMYLLP